MDVLFELIETLVIGIVNAVSSEVFLYFLIATIVIYVILWAYNTYFPKKEQGEPHTPPKVYDKQLVPPPAVLQFIG